MKYKCSRAIRLLNNERQATIAVNPMLVAALSVVIYQNSKQFCKYIWQLQNSLLFLYC